MQYCSSNKTVLSAFLGLCVEPVGDRDILGLVGERNALLEGSNAFGLLRQDLGAGPERAPRIRRGVIASQPSVTT